MEEKKMFKIVLLWFVLLPSGAFAGGQGVAPISLRRVEFLEYAAIGAVVALLLMLLALGVSRFRGRMFPKLGEYKVNSLISLLAHVAMCASFISTVAICMLYFLSENKHLFEFVVWALAVLAATSGYVAMRSMDKGSHIAFSHAARVHLLSSSVLFAALAAYQ